MTLFWFCIGVWLILNGTVVVAMVHDMHRTKRFEQHADKAIDLTGGVR